MVDVFVYGTLRRGETAHHLLAKGTWVGEALTDAAFTLVDLGAWPGLLAGGRTRVVGEVFRINPGLLPALDAYEDCPEDYVRQTIPVTLKESGARIEALTYLLRPALAAEKSPIASGDWRTR